MTVQIPGNAVEPTATDIAAPAAALLRDLNLLPSAEALKSADGFQSAFTGPPQSVAVFEAGATAFSKWWAAGLGTSVVAVWSSIAGFWEDQNPESQRMVLLVAGIATAAAVLALGYIIGSDVRGRSAASVAIIEARSAVARSITDAAESAYKPPAAEEAAQVFALPTAIPVHHTARPANDEAGWKAVAAESGTNGDIRFLVVKGSVTEWVAASGLDFT